MLYVGPFKCPDKITKTQPQTDLKANKVIPKGIAKRYYFSIADDFLNCKPAT